MAKKQLVCRSCGFVGSSRRDIKGSVVVELFLWFVFLLPGLIYSIWRLTTKSEICPKCKSTSMIPVDSPMGKKLLREIRE